ncbi:hypothetical protein [Aliarcobacter butzleri]|uniref:hypothetical protein n=1 Tax=Aliarcobacter butzleri TaxID=28197 RepID=UPI00125F4C53|nr:hypothetical protein [Aliarcobacter butzleri]
MIDKLLTFIAICSLFLLVVVIAVLVITVGGFILVLQIPRHLILKTEKLGNYFETIILALDSFAGSIIYGKRGRLFYISSIAYYDANYHNKNRWFRSLIDLLFFYDQDHTKQSFLGEANLIGLVPELDQKGYLLKWDKEKMEIIKNDFI